jgi:hypothetical protein
MTAAATNQNGSNRLRVHHLSASALSAFLECPMQFYGCYVYSWPRVYPPLMEQAATLGKIVDGALEAFHHGADPILWLCQNFDSIEGPLPPNAFAKAVGLIRKYTATESPDPSDITQQKFTLRVPGIPIPIIGYTDVERGLTVREIKTTGSKTWWTPERARNSLQTKLYSMAVSKKHHGAQVTVEHHVLNHNGGNFTHDVYPNSLNKTEIRDAENEIRETWEEIQKGELNAVCKSGRCRFPEHCREFGYVGTDTRELVLDE